MDRKMLACTTRTAIRPRSHARLLALLLGGSALAATSPALADGTTYTLPLSGTAVPVLAGLHVTGNNTTGAPQRVILRVDDYPNPPYNDRADDERILPPGPFDFVARIGMMATPGGRRLNVQNVVQAIGFSVVNGVNVTGVSLVDAPSLPATAQAWYFGPASQAPMYGFQSVLATDSRVTKGVAVANPGHDPILTNGVMTTEFATPLPNGSYHVTMWTEDAGAWQTLPPVLERRIEINGAWITYQNISWDQWVAQRYLQGRTVEADPSRAPFYTISAQRGGKVETDVTITDGQMVVDMAGTPAAAIYLAAIVAEPTDQGQTPVAASMVQDVRAQTFASDWPVYGSLPKPPNASALTATRTDTTTSTAVTTAPGGFGYMVIRASSGSSDPASASVVWEDSSPVLSQAFWGMWRWRRPDASTNAVTMNDNHLRGDVSSIPMNPLLPRDIVVAFSVPAGSAPGNYHGHVTVTQDGSSVQVPFYIESINAARPAPAAKVGPFLDFAPQWANDAAHMPQARQQATCDMNVLSWFGFTTVAPALEAPETADTVSAFANEIGAAEQLFGTDLVAYAPLRQMVLTDGFGYTQGASLAAYADAFVRNQGYAPIAWTVADEAAANGTLDYTQAIMGSMQTAETSPSFAAFVNNPGDSQLTSGAVGHVFMNEGYGADISNVSAVRSSGAEPWFYNMSDPRRAAGPHLWRTGAAGYLQWHARMPTADAFDPTDGREADIQFIWPTDDVCGTPDIDMDLITLAMGEEDLKWLTWMDANYTRFTNGPGLRSYMLSLFDGTWAKDEGQPQATVDAAMRKVQAMARGGAAGQGLVAN